jgi:CDP-glycerol glycerophosphotransferase
LSTSDVVTDLFSQRFGLPRERFLKIGFPVNDELVTRKPDENWVKKLYPSADDATKLIVYAPTFRYATPTQIFPFDDMDTGDLSRFLVRNNLVLAIRTHPNDKVRFPEWFKTIDRIVIATDTIVEDVTDLIVNATAIITDYSSIYLEGLLRGVPPIFIPYDINEYERGFPFEYGKVTPGPKVVSFAQWKDAVIESIEGAKNWSRQLDEVRNLFFETRDADSTVRLWNYITRL